LCKIQFGLELLKLLPNPVFTFGDLELIGIIEFNCRLQREEMLSSVVFFQGPNDLFGGCLSLRVFHLGKPDRSLILQLTHRDGLLIMRDDRGTIEMLWNWGLVITANRFCRAALTVTCWLLVLATIAAVFLELNIWMRHESSTGPYPQEAGSQLGLRLDDPTRL
jgi:hypothetical protein